MAKNLVYLCKDKILGIDRLLPVLLEIKKINPQISPIIIFYNDKHREAIKSNYNIWDALQSMDSRIYVIRSRNAFLTVINLIKFIMELSFGDNVILRDKKVLPLHDLTMKVLRRFSRVTEINVYLSVEFADYLKNLHTQAVLDRENAGKSTRLGLLTGEYDYFLSTLNADQLKWSFNVELPEDKRIKLGYVYKMPEWDKFRKKAVEKNEAIKDNYFFYILHTLYQRRSHLEEPDVIELIEESLDVLKKYNGKIKTIFKPHSITDIKRVEEIINRVNYTNYAIDYSHPMVLASKAKFVFGNVFSSIMAMAYYLGKPTVEYGCYDPELFTRIGRQSLGSWLCDFFIYRDKKRLDGVLNGLINGGLKIERDPEFIRNNFKDVPPEFYEFWHKLLA